MAERIVVINPNCNEQVTAGMSAALEGFRFADGPAIDCRTLAEGPPGIESQILSDQVIGPLCRMIAAEDKAASAFVIACFSDPGLHSVEPVFLPDLHTFSTALQEPRACLWTRIG